jgi:peptidoglycan glycosyltransferase
VRSLPHRLSGAALAAALALSAVDAVAAKPVDLRHVRVTDAAVFAPAGPGGAEVKTTLDPHLQRAAEHLLARSGAHEGAIVAADVHTGRILAWASLGDRDYVAEPFAPSASLFKVVTATALLEAHVSPGARECYEGGEHEIRPADLDHHGTTCTTFGEALGHSVNLVFARLAKKHLSADSLRRHSADLGFSGEVPIDVPVGASVVHIPDDPFGMARASAGFWNGQLSPLGGLFAMTTIANDGERIRLSLLDHGGTTRVSAGRALPAASARELGHMLEVTTRRGTAAKAFRRPDGTPYLPGIPVAAKTGTLIGGGRARMYSWFAGYAPSTKPDIAITVMLGNDLRWHTKANVIGRELLESWFKTGDAGKVRASAGGPGAKRR